MKIRVYVRTNERGAENSYAIVEVPDEELAGLSEDERFDVRYKHAKSAMLDMIDWGFTEVQEGEE